EHDCSGKPASSDNLLPTHPRGTGPCGTSTVRDRMLNVDSQPGKARARRLGYLAVVVVVAGLLVLLIWPRGPTVPPKPPGTPGKNQAEDSLEGVRDSLRKGADFEACRGAVQQLNTYLSLHTDEKRSLLPEERQLLKD